MSLRLRPGHHAAALLIAALLAAPAARGDAPLFIVEPSQMPFDLGPGAPANQPARAANLPTAAGNSSGAPGNSSTTHANAPDNPANGPDGGRAIWAGDEVVVPGSTFIATWLAVTQVGATPVPVDARADDGQLDVGLVEGLGHGRGS